MEIDISNGTIIVDYLDSFLVYRYHWAIDKLGYVKRQSRRNGKNTCTYLHREIMGNPPDMQIYHINMNRIDNRRCNLRICTHSQNRMNEHRRVDNKSGFKGIIWDKSRQKWRAEIKAYKERHYLGRFDNIEDAIDAYKNACILHHGEYARFE